MGSRSGSTLHDSEGRRALIVALEKRGWKQADLARALECHSGLVNRWVLGKKRPALEWAVKIRDVVGIDPALWHEQATGRRPSTPPRAA